MNVSPKRFALIAAVLIIAIAGVKAFQLLVRKPAAITQPMTSLGPFGQTAPSIPSVPAMNLVGANQMAVYKLMSQHGLPMGIASYLAQAKAQVLSQTNTSVHFALTFPNGLASDETITITPDIKYTPNQAESEQAAKAGTHIYNVKFTAKNESDTKARITLQYFVPYSAVPPELERRIHGQSSSFHRFDLISSVWAQEGGGEGLGMGVYQDTAAEVAKEFLKQQAEHGELSKEFPTPLSRIVDTLNALKKEQEHFDWLNELYELEECAEDPTNPLTKKAFEEDPSYRDQVVHGVTQARGDVTGITAMRFLNLATSVATDLVEGPLGAITSPVSSLNDETLKELAERRVSDAKKGVTACDPKKQSGSNYPPLQGILEYKYKRTGNDCNALPCATSDEERTVTGHFVLNPDPLGMGAMGGHGKATLTWKNDGTFNSGKCSSETRSTTTGDLPISAEGGGVGAAGWLRFNVGGDNLHGDTVHSSSCGQGGSSHEQWDTAGFNLSCEFTNVDLRRGGTYSSFVTADRGYGTCKIEIAPQ